MSTSPSIPESETPSSPWAAGLRLTAVVVGLWVLSVGPAYALGGVLGLEGVSWAAGLCLVPGWLVFAVGGLYGIASSATAIVAIGLAVRMLFALGGVLVLQVLRPELGLSNFTVWLLVFYMGTLAFETRELMAGLPQQEPVESGSVENSTETSNEDRSESPPPATSGGADDAPGR